MSLINDALKRARETQQQAPPPMRPLQFRPPEAAPTNSGGIPRWFYGAALIALLAGGTLLIRFASPKPGVDLRAAARTLHQRAVTPAPDPQVAVTAASPLAPGVTGGPATASTTTTPPAESVTNQISTALSGEPAVPAEPKLQGISFHPTRPSAIVNSKNLFVGDRLGGFRVLAITRSTVVLGSATTTNVLSLSE